MMLRKLVIGLCMLCLFAPSAFAGGWTDGWDVKGVTINQRVMLTLSDGNIVRNFMIINDDEFEKRVMAMAYMAIAQNSKVFIRAFPSGEIGALELLNNSN